LPKRKKDNRRFFGGYPFSGFIGGNILKLWTGRFSKEIDPKTNDFNSSIPFDSRMYKEDIEGSIAHAAMLGRQGIVSGSEAAAMIEGLGGILADIESGALSIDPSAEDIHTFVEGELTARIGDAGKRLHTARSRNDQVALDDRLYMRGLIDGLSAQIRELIGVLCNKAEAYADAVMPGYTHLQRAQPITFGHHLMAYAEMLLRDLGRLADCRRRMNISPLGSGALAGTTYPLDRESVASALSMDGVSMNSLDGVSDRDFCVEFAAALSLVMVHLSRFSEEIILWCSFEFRFIELDDAFSTGSSIMPQKKNPDIAELVRGKSGRVFGDLLTLLTVLKGLPLAYNKDMQEDKEAVFDAADTVKLCLTAFTPMLETMRVNTDRMRAAAAGGFINATDCADYLVGKGLPFRDAYKAVGMLVALCIEKSTTLEELPLAEYRKVCDLFDDGVYEAISLERCVGGRRVLGGPAPDCVRAQVKRVRGLL
jgi:argininosuccinate lyase